MSALLGLRYAEDEPPGRRFLPGPEDQDPYTGFSDVKREVFGDDISSPSQQVPAEYYEKGYQVEPVAEEDAADVVVCGCLPPLAVGYAVCVFTLIEGTVLLLHAAQVIDPNKGLFSSLYDGHNPFASTEKGFLWIASVTDLAAVIVGVVGLYLAVHVAPDSVRRGMAKGTAGNLPMVLLGSLLLWRVLITVATAPFVGVMLAFSNPETDRTPYIAGTMAFTLVNVILIYGLAQVFRAAALASDFVAERTEEINAEERRMFLQSAYSNHMELIEEEPRLFGCLPLELALGLWTLLLTVACVVWFIQLCAAGITVGGWAYAIDVPDVGIIWGLEFLTYLLGSVCALIAFVAIIGCHRARSQEAKAQADLEVDQAMDTKKRSTLAILLFFVASLFRVACFIPITGMALVAKDVCGVYARGLSALSLTTSSSGTSLHCGTEDVSALLLVSLMMALDLYVLWGVFKLWQVYRGSCLAVLEPASNMSYGAAGYAKQ